MTIAELLSNKLPRAGNRAAPPPPRLAFFDSAFARDPSDEITLPELVAMLRSGHWAREVGALRHALAHEGRDAYDRAKRSLPAIMLSGWAETRRGDAPAADRALHHSGYLQGDFDAKDHPGLGLAEMMARVWADPEVLVAFVSPSGQGVKAVIAIPADVAGHRAAFEEAAERFAKAGLKMDAATKDPGRLCFVSWDPEARIRERTNRRGAEVAERSAEKNGAGTSTSDAVVRPAAGGLKSAVPVGAPVLRATAAEVREMLSYIPGRPAYEDWLRISSAVWSALGEAEGTALLMEWSPEERPGEYARKFPKRLQEVKTGTLVRYARMHGMPSTGPPAAFPIQGSEFEVQTSEFDLSPPRDFSGPESVENPEFIDWCLRHEQRGDAELWQAIAAGTRLYDHYATAWRIWGGTCWLRDDTDTVRVEFVERLCQAYRSLADASEKDMAADPVENARKDARYLTAKRVEERILNLNRINWLRGSLEMAKGMPRLATRASLFDRAPHLLALENGVLDFDACEFREARPSDMLTHQAGVAFDPEADCPRFRAFMHRMLVDPEVVDFVMRAMAYSLTGKVDADTLFFLHGKGANGKSTFMMVFKLLLGDLMTTIDIETLLARRSDASTDYKKSTLEGRRVAVTDEMPEGRKLGESMVKALIGGDEIVARRPYEKPYTFAPTHKLWMIGNHKPTVEGTDAGIWRRICLIPWTQTIPVEQRRPRAEVVAEFHAELPGILNWVIAAWQDFLQRGGLEPPQAVREATSEYQHEQDQLGSFLEERTRPAKGCSVPAQKLLKAYLAWCEDNGEKPLYKTSRRLVPQMREKGFVTGKGHNNVVTVRELELLETGRE